MAIFSRCNILYRIILYNEQMLILVMQVIHNYKQLQDNCKPELIMMGLKLYDRQTASWICSKMDNKVVI